jgi:PAS domain S-box-containing protein
MTVRAAEGTALRLPGKVPADGHAPPDGPPRTAGQHRQAGPAGGSAAAIAPAVISKLLDALDDGLALAGHDGILTLASRRLEDMFGYQRGELPGRSVESLVPADLQDGHRRHRASYDRAPTARPMGAGARLVGQRQDGTTFPVQVSLAPLPATEGRFTLAVIRDLTQTRHLEDLAELARAAAAAEQELLDRIVCNLFSTGLSLQAAINKPDEVAGQAISEAVQGLDDTIRQIRDHLFTTRRQAQPPPAPPNRAR